MDDSVILGIQFFLLSPNVYDYQKVHLFLDACRKLLTLSQQNNFGLSKNKLVGADEVMQYYVTVIMPQLNASLAFLSLSETQLSQAALHITSLASAISQDMSMHRWSDAQMQKVNGLVQICAVLAHEVCHKQDDNDCYYQLTELYRESVQQYVNIMPDDQSLYCSLLIRAQGIFSPREQVFDDQSCQHQQAGLSVS